MKQIVPALALVALIASCGSKQQTMSENEVNAKVDSLVGLRIEEISRQAMEDRDRRIAIEVKAKADSIVQAASAQ